MLCRSPSTAHVRTARWGAPVQATRHSCAGHRIEATQSIQAQRTDEQVGDCEQALGRAVQPVHVGQRRAIVHFGCKRTSRAGASAHGRQRCQPPRAHDRSGLCITCKCQPGGLPPRTWLAQRGPAAGARCFPLVHVCCPTAPVHRRSTPARRPARPGRTVDAGGDGGTDKGEQKVEAHQRELGRLARLVQEEEEGQVGEEREGKQLRRDALRGAAGQRAGRSGRQP